MFGKFDEESQKIIKLAKKEMQEMRHEYVGTEHLMLGILKSNNMVSNLLSKHRVNYDNFKEILIKVLTIKFIWYIEVTFYKLLFLSVI